MNPAEAVAVAFGVVAVWLTIREHPWCWRVGLVNVVLFAFSFSYLDADLVLYSLFMSFISSQTLEYVLAISNQRKMVFIISDFNDRIAKEIHSRLIRGVTFLNGSGAYTGREKKVILTVVNNYQLKRLEEPALSIDPEAFIITENTFNVLGRGFSRRKEY